MSWNLTDRAAWEAARARGRGMWVARNVAPLLAVSLLTVAAALWHYESAGVTAGIAICCGIALFVTAFILGRTYDDAERRHESATNSQ